MATPDDTPLSRGEVLEVLQGLIRIPSVNPTLAPDEAHGEAEVARYAAEWMAARGARAWTEVVAPGRVNAVAEVGEGNGPTLALCAHLDTVSTEGMTIDPFEPRVDGNRVYGRGSYDMKGGAAAVMAATAELARTGLPGRVVVALVADEEYASIGAQHFVANHPADGCIVTEPSEGQLILAHKGFVWAELTTTGRAAHGSRWDLGESAIAKMGSIVAALDAFDRTTLRERTHPLCGPASMHCAMIEGGAGLSTYAPDCRLKVERRTLPGETADQVMDELRSIVASTGHEAKIEQLLVRSPMTTDREAPIACAVRDAAIETTGEAPVEAGVAYWMDAAFFHEAGIPTVDFGHGGAGAHAAEEWADLDSVITCAQVLTKAAHTFCR